MIEAAMLFFAAGSSFLESFTIAQTLPNPARCVANSNVTAFTACSWWYDTFSTCSAYAAASQPYSYYNCYCQQRMLNAIINCDSEERLCLGNPTVDVNFKGPLSIWHSECDSILNYSPTTPVLSSITAPFNQDYCYTVQSACASLTEEREFCTETVSASSQYPQLTSCLCQPSLLSLAYSCSVLGNVSCIQVPAALTNMVEYGRCTNLMTVLTIPASVTSTLGTGTTVRFTYATQTAGPSVTTSASLNPAPTSSIRSSESATKSPASSDGSKSAIAGVFWIWSVWMVATSLLLH